MRIYTDMAVSPSVVKVLTLGELLKVMRSCKRYTYEFRQAAWRELCRRMAQD